MLSEKVQNDSKIRTFFALRLRESIARQLANYADDLGVYDRLLEVQWVDSDNYHLTLCFVGDVDLEQVSVLEEAAERSLSLEKSLTIHLSSIGCYQANDRWTLITAFTQASPELNALHALVTNIAKQSGLVFNDIGFKPHITLGRLPRENQFEAPEKWPAIDLYSLADAVVFFQSKPGERGSVYNPLFTIELQALS